MLNFIKQLFCAHNYLPTGRVFGHVLPSTEYQCTKCDKTKWQ